MSRAIAHRGPDGEGYALIDQGAAAARYFSGPTSSSRIRAIFPELTAGTSPGQANIGLCHRRFAIVDLSDAGHQPFVDPDGACCAVFNGEIYNYVELRQELETLGRRFRTQSDTEVLVAAYRQWGTDCFARFNGFWAIALYDFRRGQLLLSRDRIGKKPLYWTRSGSRIYFASEIKALLRVPAVHRQRRVNEEAIALWLACGRKDLNFSTCFEGIYSLPSACWAWADERFPGNAKVFWQVPNSRLGERDITEGEAVSRVRAILEDAVRIRLRADVPVSVELSGGMDSSALVGVSTRLHPDPVTTYTVRFPEKQWDEEPFARSVGQFCRTDYRVMDSPISNFWSQVLPFTYLEEEPYHSPNLQTNQAIWARMRSMGTKVSLNGAGGDENFAGYGQYFVPAQVENLRHGQWGTYFRNSLRYSSNRTGVKTLCAPLLALAGSAANRFLPLRGRARGALQSSTLSEALYNDMTNTLMPYWLRSGDRGYMGIPLEVRAPLLDYRLIECAFRLPTTYLVRNGWQKWVLRKAVEDLLPADVVWRKQKLGFPFPYERFYESNREIVGLILGESRNPYLDLSQPKVFARDWKALSFLLWYELFFNGNLPLFRRIEDLARRGGEADDYGFSPQFLTSLT